MWVLVEILENILLQAIRCYQIILLGSKWLYLSFKHFYWVPELKDGRSEEFLEQVRILLKSREYQVLDEDVDSKNKHKRSE